MLPESLPRIFLDTDVSFDIISKRHPHFSVSIRLLELKAEGKIQLCISESSLANLIYLSLEIYKLKDGVSRLSSFVGASELIHANKSIVFKALDSDFKDKEDALQYFTALNAEVDYFITRNIKDYKTQVSELPVYSPEEFIKSMGDQ